jgi:hypothetical protein
MKGRVRLALSSYIVVVAGCTPSSMSNPTPEIGSPIRIEASPEEPQAGMLQLSVARSAPSETLSVRIHGPGEMRSIGTAQFTAAVSNGASSSRYYYWWFMASCGKRDGCSPTSYVLLAEGLSHTAVSVPFGATSAEKDLVVQVAEIDGRHRTGSSIEFPVMGPVQRLGGAANGFTGGVCDWFAGSFYPHTGEFTDPFTGKSWERRFRRDYCGNRVSWDPEG